MASKDRGFPIRDLLIALLRDQNIHEGFWGLTVQFHAQGTSVSLAGKQGENLPGLAVAVSGVTLVAAQEGEAGAVDASLVNPTRQPRVRKEVKPKTLQ
ncbi:hypothetical protein [Pseudomonas sp. PS01301]|uniref:hypothetical protein n=1 Tax=Pseudomonas sp. PS01301 TaxID=2991437 RepID=UPI00249CE7C9|nr:hypothetical protein [Pseudomonas sp. PS01301]